MNGRDISNLSKIHTIDLLAMVMTLVRLSSCKRNGIAFEIGQISIQDDQIEYKKNKYNC